MAVKHKQFIKASLGKSFSESDHTMHWWKKPTHCGGPCHAFCGEKYEGAGLTLHLQHQCVICAVQIRHFSHSLKSSLMFLHYSVVNAPLMKHLVENEASIWFYDSVKRHIAYDTQHMRLQISLVDVYE